MQERALQEDLKLAPAIEEVAEKEQPVKERYVDGEAPAVAAEGGEQGKTASQLAYDGDSNETELSSKVGALIEAQFGGDLRKAFAHYGERQSHDPSMDKEELTELLHDADVGNGMSRPEWASAIVTKLDKNGDGKITWKEFDGLVKLSTSKASDPVAPKPAIV
jgi:hypothetical protein